MMTRHPGLPHMIPLYSLLYSLLYRVHLYQPGAVLVPPWRILGSSCGLVSQPAHRLLQRRAEDMGP